MFGLFKTKNKKFVKDNSPMGDNKRTYLINGGGRGMLRDRSLTPCLRSAKEVLLGITTYFEIIMARKPKNANTDIRQESKVLNKQAFVDGVLNDDYILVGGSGVIFDSWSLSM